MIHVENLTKNFKRNRDYFDAVNQVNLRVKPGEFAVLIGHSGSGKTTLFNMIAGLIRPTSGSIRICDTDITSFSDDQIARFRNAHMGYILQGQSLLGNFNILDNICMPAYLSCDVKVFREKAMDLLNQIGLADLAKEYPSNLSGGEIRRVAIVRAMINNPDIILADEPTSNLDPENSHLVMKMLREISESGTTVLLSTHEMEYLSYADTIYSMNHGIIKTNA